MLPCHLWAQLILFGSFFSLSANAWSPAGSHASSFALRRTPVIGLPSQQSAELVNQTFALETSYDSVSDQLWPSPWQMDSKLWLGLAPCVPIIGFALVQFHHSIVSQKGSRHDTPALEAVHWWVTLPMFLHAAHVYDRLTPAWKAGAIFHHWASMEATAFFLLAGYLSSARMDRTMYVAALAVVAAIGSFGGYSPASLGGSMPLQLLWCFMSLPVLQQWSSSLGRAGFFVGWSMALLGVNVEFSMNAATAQPLVWLIFGSHIPVFFAGLNLRQWRMSFNDQWLGIGFLLCLLGIVSSADTSHLHFIRLQKGHFSYTVSLRIGTWLVIPILAAAITSLSLENDRVRKLFSPYLPFHSIPIAPWALLPSVGPLAAVATSVVGPGLAIPAVAAVCFLIGCLLDVLAFAVLEKLAYDSRGDMEGSTTALPTIYEAASEGDTPSAHLPLPEIPEAWPGQMWVHELCLHSADPDHVSSRTALVAPQTGTALTYGELKLKVEAAAACIVELSLGDGAPCALVAERNLAMVVGLLAPMVARGFPVPIEPLWPKKRQDYCIDKLQVRVVIADDRPRDVNSWGTLPMISLDANDGRLLGRSPSLELLKSLPTVPVPSSSPATIVWTSGSTGFPKAVAYSHDSVVHGMTEFSNLGPLSESSRTIVHSPFVWATLEWQVFCPLMLGAECVLAKVGGEKDPAYLAELVEEMKPSFFSLTPPLLDKMLDHSEMLKSEWLQHVMAVGTALPMACVRRFHRLCPGITLYNYYGASETAMVAWTTTDEPTSINAPVGFPQRYAGVLIVNDKEEIVTELGVKGQVVFTGLLQTYCAAGAEERGRFRDLPPYGCVYMSGDIGCIGKFGLEIFGRMDNQVQINGIRVEPAEIEVAAKECDAGVRDAACVIPDDGGAATIVLFVTPATVQTDIVKKGIKEQKPHYMVPNIIKALDAMPMLPNGKIDGQELRQQAEECISSSVVTIVDSLGQTRTLSKASLQLQRAVDCAYAVGMISTITAHWYDCKKDYCSDLKYANPVVDYLTRNLASADFLLLLFVVSGGVLDHVIAPRAKLGQRELVCLFIWWFMGWPLCTGVEYLFPPFRPCSLHRWYFMMYLLGRVYLSSTRNYLKKAEQTLFLSVAVMMIFLHNIRGPSADWQLVYFCGVNEECLGHYYSMYDRKFAVCLLLYVAAFNHAVPIGKFFGRWITPQQCCFLAPAYLCLTLVIHPNLACIFVPKLPDAQAIVELPNALVLCGLFLSAFMAFQPPALRWLGENALAAFVVHALVPLKHVEFEPVKVFRRLSQAVENPVLAIPLELTVALAYPVLGILLGAAVFRLLKLLSSSLRDALLFATRHEDKEKEKCQV